MTNRLNILAVCTQRGREVHRTWTPDWTQDSQEGRCFAGSEIIMSNPFHFNASAEADSIVRFSDDLSVMTVRGFVCDAVQLISPPPAILVENDGYILSREFRAFCKTAVSGLSENTRYETQTAALTALYKSLLIGFESVGDDFESELVALGVVDRRQERLELENQSGVAPLTTTCGVEIFSY